MKNLPKWIKAIPEGSHGSGTLQKRLWKLVSDYVRIRDWYKYGTCVATGKRIEHWKEGQAGHFKAYSKCNGMFKFNERNVHMQSAQSNSWGDFDDWKAYELELLRRYGVEELEWLQAENIRNGGNNLKITDSVVMDKMKDILLRMKDLPEQPDYFQRAYGLFTEGD